MNRVDAIHRFVGIESGGEMLDIPESQKERGCQKHDKNGNGYQFFRRKKMPEEMPSHNKWECFVFVLTIQLEKRRRYVQMMV